MRASGAAFCAAHHSADMADVLVLGVAKVQQGQRLVGGASVRSWFQALQLPLPCTR